MLATGSFPHAPDAGINNAHELDGTPLIRVKPYDKFERIAV